MKGVRDPAGGVPNIGLRLGLSQWLAAASADSCPHDLVSLC
jgi:hypothetical protein